MTLLCISSDVPVDGCTLPPLGCPESTLSLTSSLVPEDPSSCETYSTELAMLDLYAGCGGMSTGLCIGAKLSGVNLVTVVKKLLYRKGEKYFNIFGLRFHS